ncbi:signal transduction histidine kinase [Pelotomaculum thermopropionicum SI]|uniref:histidine kinase n=1 Tax=Pelotomaculum thermopropionicum (strain DSM 13744 / JCM 10971 / SI) TaxID=370438 RepID=A5D658_PELTS|nr:signal transduction histidine kinase [Pelotomaculum thermopropionicum SI]
MEDVAYLKALIRVCNAAVVAVDENMTVKVISPAAERLLNIKAGEYVGRHLKNCPLLGRTSLKNLENTLKAGVEQEFDFCLCGKNDGKTMFRLFTRRLSDSKGKTLGAALLIEVIDLNGDMERFIRNEKIKLIKQMSIGIAHHIRNPLTAVRGFIQIMREKSGGDCVTGFNEFTSIALKELDRVNEVIGNLLLLADSSELKREAVNVNNLLKNVLFFIKGKAALSGIIVVEELSPDLPSVFVNQVQIVHVLFNILDNAIKFMPDGGRLKLRSYTVPAESKVCIEVSDTGAGIPPANINKIFNPFFTTREDGMGFGLALANKIIHDHGGEIRVGSEEGKGSTFFVYLPVKNARLTVLE